MSFEKALKHWATAYKLAEKNPDLLMFDTWTQANSDLCVKRMEALSEAEETLFLFKDSRLDAFRDAIADRGCSSCWVSSFQTDHPECEMKIARYFAERATLVKLGLTIRQT